MLIEITRSWFSEKSSISDVHINGVHAYYCCEDVARALGVKIHGKTAIPEGSYSVKMTMSNRFKIMMPLVYNRPDLSVVDAKGAKWEGIRIHVGNTDVDTDGCLLFGKVKGVDSVSQSKDAIAEFYKLMTDAEAKGEKITLTITNQQAL